MAVDVAEVYSPPKIVPVAERLGLKGGTSFDSIVVGGMFAKRTTGGL